MLTDLADVLRNAGLTVIEVDGWKTRGVNGNRIYGPYGGLVHHTGSRADIPGNYPTLNTIINGRSDLQGPLAQLGLGRDGTWYVIAAGYCNHAGAVDDPDYANIRAIGVECENPGGNTAWPKVQYDSLVAGCAALARHYGFKWRGHKEAAAPKGRKVDPNLNMNTLRNKIAAYKEVDVTDQEIEAIANRVVDKLMSYEITFMDAAQGPQGSRQTYLLGKGANSWFARVGRLASLTQDWVRTTGKKVTTKEES